MSEFRHLTVFHFTISLILRRLNKTVGPKKQEKSGDVENSAVKHSSLRALSSIDMTIIIQDSETRALCSVHEVGEKFTGYNI